MAGIAIPGTPIGVAEGYVVSNWLKDHPIDVKVDKEKLREAIRNMYKRILSGDYQLHPNVRQDNAIVETLSDALSGKNRDKSLLGEKGVDEGDIMEIEKHLYSENPHPFYDPDNDPDKKEEEERKKKEEKKEKEKENYKPDSDLQEKMNRQEEAQKGLKRAGKSIDDPDFNLKEAKFEEEFQKLKRKKLNENSRLDPDAYKKQQVKDKIEMNKARPTEEWVPEDPRKAASKVNRSAAGEEIQYNPKDLLEHKIDPENPTDIKHIKSKEYGRAGLGWMTRYLKSILGIGTAAALGANAGKAEAEENAPANAEEIKKSIADLNDDEKQDLLDSLGEAYKNVTSEDESEREYGKQMFKEIGDQYGIDMPKEEPKKKEQIITGDRKKDFLGL